jgi:hypothetical protein
MNRFGMFRMTLAVLVATCPFGMADTMSPKPLAETNVGISGLLEAVVLPGTELEAKPLTDRKSPVVVRVVRVYPHGSAFRYDLDFVGLEPGVHDLRPQLRRKDGTALGELPPLFVSIAPILPKGQIDPNKLELEPSPRLGGYRLFLILFGVAWGIGLIAIVGSFIYPRRKKGAIAADQVVSLADKLRPLVEGAIAGTLSRIELANLERSLLAYWRKRLNLEAAEPGVAIDTIRNHPDGGPLMNQLEIWLHRPKTEQGAAIDVANLLAPYRDLPADEIELSNARGTT